LTLLCLPAIIDFMKIGKIVEYIDQQKIFSAVILQKKKGKLRLLNENNREVNFSEKRLSHVSQNCVDTTLGRNSLAAKLKNLTQERKALSQKINIKELWEILHEEPEEIDISAMTIFCFDPPVTSDHEAAVIRAFFKDRLYFKYNKQIFTPCTPEQVKAKKRQIEEAQRQEKLIQKGSEWLQNIIDSQNGSSAETDEIVVKTLKSYYLFGNDSNFSSLAKKILKKTSLNSPEQLFAIFVKTGIWEQNQNVSLLSMGIPTQFSPAVIKAAENLVQNAVDFKNDPLRKDLTDMPLITIDGQSTLDFDDAISLEQTEEGYTLGIHIIDVGSYIKDNDAIDRAARDRSSSIYMPDDKLPMIPSNLSEGLCSLIEEEVRPGISTIVKMTRFFEILDYSIIPSIIKVHKQMTYTEANLLNGKDDPVTTLYKIATQLREKRLKAGAIQITLPEVNVWIEDNQEIRYSKVDRENPSRMLVSEMMIFANTLMAEFLADNNIPAVFRSQAQPKQRLFKGIENTLILNFMQRKYLSRAIIGTNPEMHAGLGVKAYATATSPIRRYHDLLTQRQIRSILGYEKSYSKNELEAILQEISISVGNAGRAQNERKRYWILKYFESQKGATYEALVLDCYKDFYNVLIKELMFETKLPPIGLKLKHGDIIQVTIQHADARRDQLSLFA
jgi:exoribonuclease II